MTKSKNISVVDVIHQGGWVYSKRLAWSVGRRISQEWKREYQIPPTYEMRPKTLGTLHAPEHLKAVYPPDWRERIEETIRHFAGHPTLHPDPDIPCTKCGHPGHIIGQCKYCDCGSNIDRHIQLRLFQEVEWYDTDSQE